MTLSRSTITSTRRDRDRPIPAGVAGWRVLTLALGTALLLTQPVRAQDPGAEGSPPASPQLPPGAPFARIPGGEAQPGERVPPAVAAVIDYQRVLRDARAAKTIRDQIEGRRKGYQDQISREEKRLVDADKELTKQRAVLSADAFGQRRQDFEKRVADVQRMVQQRRRELDQVSAIALNDVRNSIIDIVGGLAEERGFNIVLPSSGVLLFSPRVDLTQDVISRLDVQLPSVKVPDQAPDRVGQQQP